MEEKKKKKAWTEPKLTALVRRKPEEGILAACKVLGGDEVGPVYTHSKCVGDGEWCYECSDWVST